MPPRIRYYSSIDKWACAPAYSIPAKPLQGVHGRWTGMLLMAELSAGHASFGEPRWLCVWQPRGEGAIMPLVKVWELQWPCRRCKAWFTRPAAHLEAHAAAERIRVARLMSLNGGA